MIEKSALDGLLKSEPSYSRLLCNLMKKYEPFRGEMMNLFLAGSASKIQPEEIQTEPKLPQGCGCPDIVIRSHDLCLVLELKIRPERGLTEHQEINNERKGAQSYVCFLSQHNNARHKKLVFLVPKGWSFEPKLAEDIKLKKEELQTRGVEVEIKCWDAVRDIIRCYPTGSNTILEEFGKLLSAQNLQLSFKKEEVEMILSPGFFDSFRIARKLEFVIDAIGQEAKNDAINTDQELSEDDYGLLFRNDQKKNVLYFGIWPDASHLIGSPLCFGVDGKMNKKMPELSEAFSKVCRDRGLPTRRLFDDDWTVSWFSEDFLKEALEGENSTEKIWAKLQPVLNAVRDIGLTEGSDTTRKVPQPANAEPSRRLKGNR